MNTELIAKIDKFRLMVALKTGFDLDPYEPDPYDFIDSMELLERISRVRKNPMGESDLGAAIYAADLGLTLEDFHQWWAHYEQLEEQRRAEEERQRELEELEEERRRAAFELTIPQILKLESVNKFQEIESKQYPNQHHFKFVRMVGKHPVEITCRVFSPKGGNYRLWYQFKNPATNKTERHMKEGSLYWFNCPKWFPNWWKIRWSMNYRMISLAFAYAMTSTWTREFGSLVKPQATASITQ